jgi:phospholipid/cholesterol/gamma-HCH transport system ATP-binding protein
LASSDNNSKNGHFLGALNPLGTFWTKLAHGFSPSIIENDHCQADYEGSQGVDIRIENLNKSFGDHHVLKDINLTIEPGETFSIIGPSGTGKSLLLKHIVKLEIADSGQILINGHDVNESDSNKTKRNFRYSMVFQSSALFN